MLTSLNIEQLNISIVVSNKDIQDTVVGINKGKGHTIIKK